MFKHISVLLLCLTIFSVVGCANPMASGKFSETAPLTRTLNSDPNTIYYAVKWAFDQAGLPLGVQDFGNGVIESKWVPVGAGTHYVSVFQREDYGANNAYYKMVIRIIPDGAGVSKVEASTKVQAIVNNVKSKGIKEEEILKMIAVHTQGNDLTVTNLGVE